MLSAPPKIKASTTQEQPKDTKRIGTPIPDRAATPSGESNSSDDDPSDDEDFVSCLAESLSLDMDCKRMFEDETKMLTHNEREMGQKAVPVIEQAVNEDAVLFNEARA
jgi:hypothetical protein